MKRRKSVLTMEWPMLQCLRVTTDCTPAKIPMEGPDIMYFYNITKYTKC